MTSTKLINLKYDLFVIRYGETYFSFRSLAFFLHVPSSVSSKLRTHSLARTTKFIQYLFISWRMQTLQRFLRPWNSTDEGSGPKCLERNSNYNTALLFINLI